MKISIKKCRKCLEINLVYFALKIFYPKKAMSQAPCFNIEYSRSHRLFLSRKLKVEQNTKYLHRIALTFLNFQYNNIPLQFISTASFGGHSECFDDYIHVLWTVFFVISSFHHGRRHFIFDFFCSNVVSVVYSWNFPKI